MMGKGDKIVQEIYEGLLTFEHREMASHPKGDQYGAVCWTIRCLVNPKNFERWLKPIIEQADPDLFARLEGK